MSERDPQEPHEGPEPRRFRYMAPPVAMRMLARPPLIWTIVILVFALASLFDYSDDFGRVKVLHIRVSWLTFALLGILWLPTLLRVLGAFAMRPPRRRWRWRRRGRWQVPPPPMPPGEVFFARAVGETEAPVEPEPDD